MRLNLGQICPSHGQNNLPSAFSKEILFSLRFEIRKIPKGSNKQSYCEDVKEDSVNNITANRKYSTKRNTRSTLK